MIAPLRAIMARRHHGVGSLPLEAAAASFTRQRHNGPLATVVRGIAPAIHRLFGGSGPSAIARFIVAVVVDPIDRMADWTRSHVSVERLKRFAPGLTNLDSTASVVLVGLLRRALTAIKQGAPHAVFTAPPTTSRMAVREILGTRYFSAQAPAAAHVPILQISCLHAMTAAAIAAAFPVHRILTDGRQSAHGCQSAELHSRRRPFQTSRHRRSVYHEDESCEVPAVAPAR